MYGMIHKAGRWAVVKLFGEEAWDNSLKRCGISEEHNISAAYYDDKITFALVDAVAKECGITPTKVLWASGRYWVEYAIHAGYGKMFSLTGETLPEFLANLDRMHTSLKVTLPKAVMPSFQLVSADPDFLEVIYRSERDGLEEFVNGILEGLLEHFDEQAVITYTTKEDGTYFRLVRTQEQALESPDANINQDSELRRSDVLDMVNLDLVGLDMAS